MFRITMNENKQKEGWPVSNLLYCQTGWPFNGQDNEREGTLHQN